MRAHISLASHSPTFNLCVCFLLGAERWQLESGVLHVETVAGGRARREKPSRSAEVASLIFRYDKEEAL